MAMFSLLPNEIHREIIELYPHELHLILSKVSQIQTTKKVIQPHLLCSYSSRKGYFDILKWAKNNNYLCAFKKTIKVEYYGILGF